MASISHLAAGALCGAIYARRSSANPIRSTAAFAALALASDLDFIALELGLNDTPLGHRRMTHSLPFALVLGPLVGLLAAPAGRKGLAATLCAVALASHGLLDAMTASGGGPQLLWPFVTTRIQFGWQPIPGTRFYQDYFTPAGIPVLSVEALLCVPFLVAAAWVLFRRDGWARPDV